MAKLVVVEGSKKGTVFELAPENLLGSGGNSSIQFQDPAISPEHFKILQDPHGTWLLTCIDKNQVVKVNHRRCLHRHLEHSDLILLGETALIFLQDDEKNKNRLSRQISPKKHNSNVYARCKTYKNPQDVIATLTKSDKLAKRLTVLYKISNLLGQFMEFSEHCQQILSILFKEFPCERGSILWREKGEAFQELVGYTKNIGLVQGVQISKTILKEVTTSKDAVLTKDAITDERFQGGQSIVELNIHSAICVPLMQKQAILGILYIDAVQGGEAFSENDLKLFTAIGLQISHLFEKVRLEKIQREKKILEEQMKDAEKVQQFLIPQKLFQPVGLEIASKYVLSQGLGGDYYDVIPLDHDRTAIVVADVSGHNISSALVMCICRSVLRQFCKELDSPSEILQKTNEILVDDIVSGMYITLFLAIFDPSEFTITYANAGHPYPIHLKEDGSVEELDFGSSGPPLGILSEGHYQEEHLSLSQGEGLLIFTDGLIEMPSLQGEFFGTKNLQQVLKNKISMKTKDIVESTFQMAHLFSSGQPLGDDISIVMLKVPTNLSRHRFMIFSQIEGVEKSISQIIEKLQSKGFGRKKENHLRLVLREALLNAMIHGNKHNIDKTVSVLLNITDERAYLQIRDEGKGFDTHKIIDDFKWIPGESSHGRGILLIRQYVDRMRYNKKGNELYFDFHKGNF